MHGLHGGFPRRVGWACLGVLLASLAGCELIMNTGEQPGPSVLREQPPSMRPDTVPPPTLQQVNGGTPGMTSPPLAAEPGSVTLPAPNLAPVPAGPVPRELEMRSLPPYVVEPPDILLLDTTRLIPRPPYTVSPLDVLLVRVAEPLPNQPIEGTYTVTPDGTINLGYSYGLVRVSGLTLEDVERSIRRQLARVLKEPQVAVGLAQYRGVQLVRGEHLVRMDGTISLGSYGCVYVTGLTLAQVKVAVERHLTQFVVDPEINVDVLAYNSKSYYVITDGAGFGQQVRKLPITGKETVLDAIAGIQGLPAVASKKKIWVARPAPGDSACLQILPVDWRAISEGGATSTNYQLFPGDRVFVGPDPWIRLDNAMAKLLGPLERVLGVTLLGSSAYSNVVAAGSGTGAGTGTAFIAPLR